MVSSMGEVSNKGVELTVSSVNIRNRDLNWTTGLTFWLNRNKLVHLYGEDLDGDGREDDDEGNSLFIGKSIHAIFGYRQDGIIQTNDTEYISKYQGTPGQPKYVDITGDGKLDADDRIILGSADPNFKLNLNSRLTYRNWELYVLFAGVFGGNGYYQKGNTMAFMAGGDPRYFGANTIYIPYWTESNPSNKYPSPTFTGDSRFLGLQDRTHVRLQDLTLSYTFRQAALLQKANISNLKVFFTGKNLFTFTGWTAGDPETGSTILAGEYPVLTTYSIGLNLSF
jgi:hypothetical protein